MNFFLKHVYRWWMCKTKKKPKFHFNLIRVQTLVIKLTDELVISNKQITLFISDKIITD